mgnify:CR=1 FL=1
MIEIVGTIKDIKQTFPERKTVLTIEVETAPAKVEELKDKLLSIVLKPYRKKRTLNANDYYWVLCTKIAEVQKVSKTEMHNILLAEYGAEKVTDGAFEWAVKSPTFDWTKSTTEHYRPSGRTVKTDSGELPLYWVIRGSHTYDTEEMSRLIDGTVYEAKERGIETLTPDEIAKIKAAWKGYEGGKN